MIEQLFKSVTTTLYVPVGIPLAKPLFPGWDGVQEYVYPGVPFWMVVDICPLLPPKHETGVVLDAANVKACGCAITTEEEATHPFASIMFPV